MSDSERRHFSRIDFQSKAELTLGSDCWACDVIDISLKGVLVARPRDWSASPGEQATFYLPLAGDDTAIEMETEVAHCNDHQVGLACQRIDIDSIAHLKRLMELNLGDVELVHRELSTLGS